MRICSAGTAFPPYRYSQTVIAEALRERWQHKMKYPNASRLLTRLHTNCGVEYRNLVFPLEHYPALDSFGKSNDAWIAAAVDLGQKAVCSALNQAGVSPEDVSAIFFVSVTGICSPSIDARLANRLAFPVNIKRIPSFGLGCVAGAAAVARAADYVRAF
ncbi:MAG: type III polyketide synthase, partial [Acidobacteriaceae bacterium]|nr:type III polyketide synthase [Acidobacteriaceae bacterium]